jgi:hypothetical protein
MSVTSMRSLSTISMKSLSTISMRSLSTISMRSLSTISMKSLSIMSFTSGGGWWVQISALILQHFLSVRVSQKFSSLVTNNLIFHRFVIIRLYSLIYKNNYRKIIIQSITYLSMIRINFFRSILIINK